MSLQWNVCWEAYSWELGTQMRCVCLSLGYHWHQCSRAPWEATLLYFSVSPAPPGLAWGGGAARENSKGNETVETGGRHGTEQAPATSAIQLVIFPVHTHTSRFSHACSRLLTTLAIKGPIVGYQGSFFIQGFLTHTALSWNTTSGVLTMFTRTVPGRPGLSLHIELGQLSPPALCFFSEQALPQSLILPSSGEVV